MLNGGATKCSEAKLGEALRAIGSGLPWWRSG